MEIPLTGPLWILFIRCVTYLQVAQRTQSCHHMHLPMIIPYKFLHIIEMSCRDIVTIATPYVKILKCMQHRDKPGLVWDQEPGAKAPVYPPYWLLHCCNIITQSLLFMPVVRVQEATAVFSWMIGLITQTIHISTDIEREEIKEAKTLPSVVFFFPLTSSGFQTVQNLPCISVNLYASVVNTIKMAVKTDTIISWCLAATVQHGRLQKLRTEGGVRHKNGGPHQQLWRFWGFFFCTWWAYKHHQSPMTYFHEIPL